MSEVVASGTSSMFLLVLGEEEEKLSPYLQAPSRRTSGVSKVMLIFGF